MNRIIGMALLISGLATSCDKDSMSPDCEECPLATFTMEIIDDGDLDCPIRGFRIVLDPSSSKDDKTPTNDLEIRWDFDNDGQWDTDFVSLRTYEFIEEDPRLNGSGDIWVVRLQVRDFDGNVSEVSNSLDLSSFPKKPDIIAGSLRFQFDGGDYSYTNEVKVNEPFRVWAGLTCFGDMPDVVGEIRQDGILIETISTSPEGCKGDLGDCPRFGWSMSIDTPGEYEFVFDIDVENSVDETNEENNRVVSNLSVLNN